MIRGLAHYAWLMLRLNFRSRQAIIYGYLVPLFFLLAFGSVFRGGQPLLLGEMGQLLTITILGGACFGLPTGLVAERERGVWRLYRLMPVPLSALLGATLAVRLVIVAGAVAMQIVLAHLIYGTPWPAHPVHLVAGFLLVAAAFLAMGLVIAALAGDVPAVQALGQCLFLPMIMIGGVGVPLAVLPEWAQQVACFMPGRYAVETLQSCFSHPAGLGSVGFSLLALVTIGASAALAGLKLFRWDATQSPGRHASVWVAAALIGWIATGVTALLAGRVDPVSMSSRVSFASITEEQIADITFENLPEDDGIYTPIAPPRGSRRVPPRIEEMIRLLPGWRPGNTEEVGQNVRNLVALAAIADIGQDRSEAEIGRLIYEQLQTVTTPADLRRALGWIVLHPDDGRIVTSAPELALRGEMNPDIVRERSAWYARKYLGRVLGRIPDAPPLPTESTP